MKPVTYLLCPYSDEQKFIMECRFECANKAAAYLKQKGYNCFSPISHSHSIAKYMNNANDSDYWVELDLVFMSICNSVHVLKIDGWDKSKEIKRELEEAIKLNLPVYYIEYDEIKFNCF